MPISISDYTGDGVNTDKVDVDILLPDSGTNITVSGTVQKVGNAAVTVASTVLTSPGVPGSGTNYLAVQVDYTTGIATIATSTSGIPAESGTLMNVFTQTIPTGDSTDPVLQGGDVTPDK